MSLMLAGFGLAAATGLGGLGYWMHLTRNDLRSLLDAQRVLQEAQATHFHGLNTSTASIRKDFADLQGTLHALREMHPELDASLHLHAFLGEVEASPEALSDVHRVAKALRSLVEHETAEDFTTTTLSLVHQRMLVRLLEALDRQHIGVEAMHLDGAAAQRLGVAALHLHRHEWADSALNTAHRSQPGNLVVLKGLEHLARLRGDDALLRHWLEARMLVTPDDPELLRAHAHLLAAHGDQDAERAVRRLEAMGVDTPADRSLLSGLRARAGARSEAIEAIEMALEEDDSRAVDWLQYATLLEAEGELNLALEANERCLSLDRQCGEAWALKARLCSVRNGQERDALKAATHAVALGAGGVDTLFLKAHLLEMEGSHVAAEEGLVKALNAAPDNAELRARLAGRYLLDLRIGDAQALLDGTPSGIDHHLLHTVEGRLHLARADRRRDGTGQTDAQLLGVAKRAFEGALALNRESGMAWLGMARTQRLLRELDVASESLARASRLMPEHDPSVACEAALLALDQHDLASAKAHADMAEVNGATATTLYIRGNIAALSAQFGEAVKLYTDCLTANPAHVRARLNRSSVLSSMGEPQKALDDAEILLDLAPQLGYARLRKGESLMELGDWESASAEFKHVLEGAPHHTQALTSLARCYMGMGRPERAEGPLNEALRQSPDHAPAWHTRGLLYLEWDKVDVALSDFEAAVRCNPNHIDARLNIAQIHQREGRLHEEEAAWRGLLAIDPEHEMAKSNLNSCETTLMKTTR